MRYVLSLGLLALISPALGAEPSGALLEELAGELRLHVAGQVGETRPLVDYAFGPGTNVTAIQPAAFFNGPADESMGSSFDVNDLGILEGEFTGTTAFTAPLVLPNGALIDRFCLVADESDSGGSVNLFLIATEVDPTPAWANDPMATFVSTGVPQSPGWTRVCASDVDILHQSIADVDDDGIPGILIYSLLVTFNSDPDDGLDDQQLGAVEIGWHRTLSPAPSSATFDDVPTDHLFFQQVEALVASGITAGCDADSYCPSAPLTRGQMAAFLAKALGLHWPQ